MAKVNKSPILKGGVWHIPLTRGLSAIVDEVDLARVSAISWYADVGAYTVYARARDGSRMLSMHSFILNCEPPKFADHVDRNGLNNQRTNLRVADRTENYWNSAMRVSQFGFRGVSFHSGKFAASVARNKRRHEQWGYSTAEDVARARDDMARKLCGAYARMNFPLPGELPVVNKLVAERRMARNAA